MQQFCTYGSVRGASGQPVSLPRQKPRLPTPIALSFAEGCARSPRVNVLPMYVSAGRFFARLASRFLLSSLQEAFSQQPARTSRSRVRIGHLDFGCHAFPHEQTFGSIFQVSI